MVSSHEEFDKFHISAVRFIVGTKLSYGISYMPSPFYPESVMLFELHGGMVSHMQVLIDNRKTIY